MKQIIHTITKFKFLDKIYPSTTTGIYYKLKLFHIIIISPFPIATNPVIIMTIRAITLAYAKIS